jgi:uncharacterized protein (DUF362 family)
MTKVKVSIVKNHDPYEGVRKAIEILCPESLSFRDTRVLLKPNIIVPFPPEGNPSNTHPDVVGALVRYLKDEGAQRIFIGDSPIYGLSARLCYEKSGMKQVVEREGGELVVFEEEKRIRKKIPHGRIFDSISLPAILEEVDILINVPKMKVTGETFYVTLGIKNLLGLIPFHDRKRFHRGVDLSYALIDIAKIVRPHLNVIDGIIASDGDAHFGVCRPLGILIASQNMVAADIIATQVMGIDPMKPVVHQLALKDKLGIESLLQIEVMGEKLQNVITNFHGPTSYLVHPEPNVEVIPGGICPGCIFRIPKIPPDVDPKKKYGIIIGKRVKFPKNQEFDEIWCFGDCGIEEGNRISTLFPNLKEKMKRVKGCPPLDWWSEKTVKKKIKEGGMEC